MTNETKVGLGALMSILIAGGLVLLSQRSPVLKKVITISFQSFEIAVYVLLGVFFILGWYIRRKHPELSATDIPRRHNRRPNPYRGQLVIALVSSAAGFAALGVSVLYFARTGGSPLSTTGLALGTVTFAAGLIIALPRIRRFAQHAAEEIARDLTDPPRDAT